MVRKNNKIINLKHDHATFTNESFILTFVREISV